MMAPIAVDTFAEITLARHGRSSHAPCTRPITAREFREWIAEYNRAGISPDSLPPSALVALAAEVPCVISSDLPRAIESAYRLSPAMAVRTSSLFREAGRPHTTESNRGAAFDAWDRLSVYLWSTGRIITDEPIEAAAERAELAARELSRLADELGRVLCVGHGTFNAMIGKSLTYKGWIGPASVSDDHWGVTTFRQSTCQPQPRPTMAWK